jgi:nuclease A inhibitor-like protein
MMSATAAMTARREEQRLEMAEDATGIVTRLQVAAQGLQYTSESDAPVEPVVFPGAASTPVDARRVLELTHHPARTPVRVLSVDEFFEPATREQAWHNAQERQTVARFRDLVQTLKANLTDVQVFKIGEVESDVYVLGKSPSGDLAGVKTHVVET